jgi:carotene biosynthesis associated membrane protein
MRIAWRGLPWAFAAATIALQIPYPLLHGTARQAVTIASVLTFAAATLSHLATRRRTTDAVKLLLVVGLLSFAVEAVGVRTGYPFGTYTYGTGLGPKLTTVPLLVPLAWTMMTWPALVAARRITSHWLGTPVLAAIALAGWDLFLDPQMVRDGNWTWSTTSTSPALQGIPWTNLAGWLAAALVIALATNRVLPPDAQPKAADRALPLTLFLWTYAGSLVANAVFLDRPGVAVSGGLGMGLVALPLTWLLVTGHSSLPRVTPRLALR